MAILQQSTKLREMTRVCAASRNDGSNGGPDIAKMAAAGKSLTTTRTGGGGLSGNNALRQQAWGVVGLVATMIVAVADDCI